MSSIDNRVVNLRFDGDQFKAGIASALDSISKLKSGLNFKGIQKEANKISLDDVGNSAVTAGKKLGIMSIAGVTAVATLANKAVDAGLKMGSALVDPIVAGGKKRAQNLEQANTLFEGLGVTGKKLTKVNNAVMSAVDGTAYSFDVAAKMAGSFIASNVPIGKLESTIKGVAGAAAITGTSMEEIGDIMQNVAGNGRLMGSDLQRFSARGINAAAMMAKYYKNMGKTALDTESEVRAAISKGLVSFEDFSDGLDKAYSKQASKANETYTGAVSNMKSALSRIGVEFAASNFERLRRSALAAKDVFVAFKKAIPPLEEAYDRFSRMAAKNTEDLLGSIQKFMETKRFKKAIKAIADGMQNLNDAISGVAKPIGRAWKAIFGGKGNDSGLLLQNLAEGFRDLTALLVPTKKFSKGIESFAKGFFKAIKIALDAVTDFVVYIRENGSKLPEMIEGWLEPFAGAKKWIDNAADAIHGFFKNFTLIPSETFLDDLRKNLEAVGKYFKPTTDAVSKLGDALAPIKETILEQAQKALERIQKIFEPVSNGFTNIRDAIAEGAESGNWFEAFFEVLKAIGTVVQGTVVNTLTVLLSVLKDIFTLNFVGAGDAAANFFKSIGNGAMDALRWVGQFVSDIITGLGDLVKKMIGAQGDIVSSLGDIASGIGGLAKGMGAGLQPLLESLGNGIGKVIDTLAKMFSSLDLDKILAGFNLVLLYKIVDLITLFKKSADAAANIDVLGGLTGALESFQTAVKADLIMSIAKAMFVLAGSLMLLSLIDPNSLAAAGGAMIGLAIGLANIMVLMSELSSAKGAGKMPFIAVGMQLMASAIGMLSLSLKLLSTIPEESLMGAISSMVLLMAATSAMATAMGAVEPAKIMAAGAAMNLFGMAIGGLVTATVILSALDPAKLWEAIKAMGILMVMMTIMATVLGKVDSEGLMAAGAAMNLFVMAVGGMVMAVMALAAVDPEQLNMSVTALGKIMLMMTAMTAIISLMDTEKLAVAATGILAIAGAVALLAVPVMIFANLPYEQLNQGLGALIIVMISLVVAAGVLSQYAEKMPAIAAGLLGMAGAVMIMSVAVQMLASMDLGAMIQGLVGLAAVMGILVLAMKAAQSSIGGAAAILAIGAALLLLSVALKVLSSIPFWPMVGALTALAIALGVVIAAGYLAIGAAPGLGALAIAFLAFAGAALVVAVAMAILGPAMLVLTGSLLAFAVAAPTIASAIPTMLQLVGMLVIAAAAAAIAAVPFVALGAGILALGIGMIALSTVGLIGATIMTEIGKAAAGLIMYAGPIAIVGAAFLALGVGLAGAGVGLVAVAVGIVALVAALLSLVIAATVATVILGPLVFAIIKLTPMGPKLLTLGQAMVTFGTSTLLAASAIGVAIANMARLSSSIKTVSTSFVGVGTASATMAVLVTGSVATLTSVLSKAESSVKSSASSISNSFVDMSKGLSDSSVKMGTSVTTVVAAIITALTAGNILVKNSLGKIVTTVVTAANDLRNKKSDFNTAAAAIVAAFGSGLNFGGLYNETYSKALSTGSAIIAGVRAGINNGIPSVRAAAANMARTALNTANEELGIHSPSKKFKAIGKFVTDGFVEGLVGGYDSVKSALSTLKTEVKQFLTDTKADLKDWQADLKAAQDKQKSAKTALTKANKALDAAKKKGKGVSDAKESVAAKEKAYKKAKANVKELESSISTAKSEISAAEKARDLTSATKAMSAKTRKETESSRKSAKSRMVAANKEATAAKKELKSAKTTAAKEKAKTKLAKAQTKAAKAKATYDAKTLKLQQDTYFKKKEKLKTVSKRYDAILEEIDDAKDDLKAAKQERDDYNESVTEQYSDISSFDAGYDRYMKRMQNQYDDNVEFQKKLKKLQDMGLDDGLYKQLVADGADAIPFMDELIGKGKSGVKELNKMQKKIDDSAASLGKQTSSHLYQAGVDTAQGVLDGLRDKKDELKKTMEDLADSMVNAIKKKLKIKSPSRVLMGVGDYMMKGLDKGIAAGGVQVAKTTADVGNTAIEELRKAMGEITNNLIADGTLDATMSITPVLDLSKVSSDAASIQSMLSGYSASVGSSIGAIDPIAAKALVTAGVGADSGGMSTGEVNFTQINNSPKALSRADIYRETKNGVSTLKGVLGKK